MPRNDHRPGLRYGAFPKGEGGPGNAAGEGPYLSGERRALRGIDLAELRLLVEEGKASGLSEEDGEALIDRLEARYRSLVRRKPGI